MISTRSKARWPLVPLGTLAEFRNGINFSKANFGIGIKVIGVSDFQNNVRASFDDLEQINPEGVVRKEHLLKNGDIIFVRSNGNRDLIGRSMFVDGLREGITHSAFSIRLRFVSETCDPRFYAYLFRTHLIRQALSLHGGGTNISNLNQDILGRLPVPHPPKSVQCKIASILSAYDDLIENNARRSKILEQMAKMIYREWFVNLRFPGHEKVKMIESADGTSMPDGWRLESVGTTSLNFDSKRKPLSSIEREKRKGPYPYYGAAKVFDYIDDYIFDGRYLLFAEDGSVITGDRKPVLQLTDGKFWPNNHTHVLQGKPPVSTNFLYLSLQDVDISGCVTGAAQPKITQANLNRIPVLVPTQPLLNDFDAVSSPMLEEVTILNRQNANLRQTRDLLLPKLISGEVNVANFDTEAVAQGV